MSHEKQHVNTDKFAVTAVIGNLPSDLTFVDAEACIKEKLHNLCAVQPEIYSKGDFRGMLFAKFRSTDARDHAVETLAKAKLHHGSRYIWINKARPAPIRCQFSLLYGVKKLLKSWMFSAGSLWVDEDDHALLWNGDPVVSTSIVNEKFSLAFGPAWKEFLLQGNLAEIYSTANSVLQKSIVVQREGKGEGKGKGKNVQIQSVPQVFGIDVEDY